MLRFTLFGIPVGVDWWFWLTVALIGGGLRAQGPAEWMAVALFAAVAFLSILVHELGHAFAARRFGVQPAIKLHAFGGAAYLHGARFTPRESMLVSAAGPAAGLLLGFVFLLLSPLFGPVSPWVRVAFFYGIYINFIWTFFNLLPIQPMDGGQILREALGPKRFHLTCGVGFLLAGILGVLAIIAGQYFVAALLAFMAYHNFQQHPVEGGVIRG
jgi:stage IV sporulation protein FB